MCTPNAVKSAVLPRFIQFFMVRGFYLPPYIIRAKTFPFPAQKRSTDTQHKWKPSDFEKSDGFHLLKYRLYRLK
jgi:hypothetical protein